MCKFWLFTVPLAVCVFAGHVPAKGDVTGETVHACSTLSVAMFSMDGSNLLDNNKLDNSDKENPVKTLLDSADYYESDLCSYSKAIEILERAQGFLPQYPDRHQEAVIEYRLARLYLKKELYHKTLEHVLKAQDIFSGEKDTCAILDCYNLLGVIYYTCREYGISKEYFDKFAMGAKELNDTTRIISSMNNAALLASTVNDTAAMHRLINQSIDLCSMQKDSVRLGKLYLNVFEAYLGLGDTAKASECLSFAENLFNSDEDRGTYYMKLGLLSSMYGKIENAIVQLNTALEYFKNGEFEKKKLFCLNVLHKLYAEKDDWEKAYQALEYYYEIDGITEDKDVLYELFRYQSEQKIKAVESKEQAKQNKIVLISFSVLSLLLLVVMCVIMNMKKNRLMVKYKENELANEAKILEMKKLQQYYIDKLAEKTVDELNVLKKGIKESNIRNKVNQISREVLRYKSDENNWGELSRFMPEYNSPFYQNLIREFPNLSINERRLCVLLNKNMTTKEISEITQQSQHSINTARGRLRAKLGITDNKITLQEFLSKYN